MRLLWATPDGRHFSRDVSFLELSSHKLREFGCGVAHRVLANDAPHNPEYTLACATTLDYWARRARLGLAAVAELVTRTVR